ncbi:OmpA family lipoprotein, partial [Vibrio parahaemolyticus]|nr:OmpA family lipoprotein [Vibrio parahaemolyticus]
RGVDQRRISTLGFGPSQPIASNATSDGRAQNRRVEVLISPLKG